MAEKKGGDIGSSWVASGDLSANQFRFVTNVGLNQNDFNVMLCGSGAFTVGVQQNKPKNKEEPGVINCGWTKVFLAGSLAGGIEIQPGVGGGATAALSGGLVWAAGWLPCGGNSGEVVSAFIQIRKMGQ
jgi:hypothetical protein